ncbi:hypothetical protein ACC668_13890 [Rhizobium ruizarguesonis]
MLNAVDDDLCHFNLPSAIQPAASFKNAGCCSMNSTFMKPQTVMLFRRMSLMEAGSRWNDGFAKVSSL